MKLLTAILLVLSVSACSTVAGLGKDIQKSAEWTRDQISGTKLD